MLFGSYPFDGENIREFTFNKIDKCLVDIPKTPKISKDCKDVLEAIFVIEKKRVTITEIKEMPWFTKKWKVREKDRRKLAEYFENLGLERQETQEFEFDNSKPYNLAPVSPNMPLGPEEWRKQSVGVAKVSESKP